MSTTDEPTDEDEFGAFPTHLEFIQMLRQAQEQADESNKKVQYTWRGYKSSVFPRLPPFTTKVLWDRLKMALKGVFNITVEERKVK